MVGVVVSHYRIHEHLGGGGMGVVYRAEDLKLKRAVALKFLPPELTRDPDAKDRFISEAQTASGLQHTNICVIHDIDEADDGRMFIVMEYYGGKTLKQLIEETRAGGQGGGLPVESCLNIAVQVAQGLEEAHEHGIIHRDIKPANIQVTAAGVVKILDFGLAKLIGQMRLTRTGTTVGTAAYMSPEQARGDPVDRRTDIWSLGVVLYELLTGTLPFRGEFEQGIIYSILNENPRPVAPQAPALPPGLEAIISKALEKEPSARYQTLREMLKDLVPLVAAGMSGTHPPPTNPRKAGRFARSVKWLIPALLVLLSLAGYLLLHDRELLSPELTTDLRNVPVFSSVAVLPFNDLSPTRDQEYFCIGIAQEISTQLKQIPELKIVSRSSPFAPQEKQLDTREMGKQLGVAAVLDGSVRKAGDQVRISVQLVGVADGFQIWSDQYDGDMKEVYTTIQEKVARSVAAALQIALAPQIAERMLSHQTRNAEALDYFLRGNNYVRTYLVSYREPDIRSAVKMFERAISLDSMYALAYGGLAWAYEHRYVYGRYKDPRDREQVVWAVRQAYRLDPNSGSINAGMGYVTCKMGAYDSAYTFFQRAVELEPRSLWVNHLAGEFLATIGLHDRAGKFFLKAIDFDPNYLFAIGEMADCLEITGEFDKAARYYQQTLALSPDDRVYKSAYINLLIKTGDLAQAESILREAIRTHPEFTEYSFCRALLLARRGEKAEALKLHKRAEVYALLNMRNDAIRILEEDAGKKVIYQYLGLRDNPFFKGLHGDQRFQVLLAAQKEVYEQRLKKYGDL